MADKSKIEWTDATWNPITGCTRVSRGCDNCYAERLAAGRLNHHPSRAGLTDDHGRWNGEVRFNEEWLDQPLHWRKPRRIFVVAHGDLFHKDVPDAWIDKVFAVMAMAPQHVFQVLTKRPERCKEYLRNGATRLLLKMEYELRSRGYLWKDIPTPGFPLPHVWIGTSVEDQGTLYERGFDLVTTHAAVRWLSVEPLLRPVDISSYLYRNLPDDASSWIGDSGIDWVVVGGESGPGYRPMEAEWARSIRDQCKLAGVPFFMKQMAGKVRIPADLLIREYPT